MSKTITVIGGGGAGMMAAIKSAEYFYQNKIDGKVVLLEKNEKLGKKVFITGKGRCNLTNAGDTTEFFDMVPRNSKFLYSAIYGFDSSAVMEFFEQEGLSLKVERGNRVFPSSDHSSDVIRTLEKALNKYGVEVVLNCEVKDISWKREQFEILSKNKSYFSDSIILATGGISYESTGSTGDGIRWAERLGHEKKKMYPALVPIVCSDECARQMQGLSLKNVSLKFFDGKKLLFDGFGEMLFTHFGISGPLVLSASSLIGDKIEKGPLKLEIDLKSALSEEQLDKRILREFEENKNKNFENCISSMYPSKLIPVIIKRAGIDPYKKVHDVTKQERSNLIKATKHFELTATSLRGFNEAIITRGGVSVKDINPSTMESKRIKGLYFAGEMIDVDAFTGGYNLQIAWSTGCLAGVSAAQGL